MKYILIFGGSTAHGVGAANGWADRIKQALHERMYGEKSTGDACYVYELGVPGNTVRDLAARFEAELHARVPSSAQADTLVVFTGGANDSKAINEPNAYLFTPAEFGLMASSFLKQAKSVAGHVVAFGLTPVDESKTSPKKNPITGGKSYYKNNRLAEFESALGQACEMENVPFVPLFKKTPKDWAATSLAADGMHPNDAGHEWIYQQVLPHVTKFFEKAQ